MERSTVSALHTRRFSESLTWSFVLTSICRQLGQLFMMGFDGTVVNDQIRTLITTYHVGSILLTAKNFECADTPLPILSYQVSAYESANSS